MNEFLAEEELEKSEEKKSDDVKIIEAAHDIDLRRN